MCYTACCPVQNPHRDQYCLLQLAAGLSGKERFFPSPFNPSDRRYQGPKCTLSTCKIDVPSLSCPSREEKHKILVLIILNKKLNLTRPERLPYPQSIHLIQVCTGWQWLARFLNRNSSQLCVYMPGIETGLWHLQCAKMILGHKFRHYSPHWT